MSDHYCQIGGMPRPGGVHIRRCYCGELWIYGHGRTGLGLMLWRPMGKIARWRYRKSLRQMAYDLWTVADG